MSRPVGSPSSNAGRGHEEESVAADTHSSQRKSPPLLDLPPELFEAIVSHLDYFSVRALSQTNSSLRIFFKPLLPSLRIQQYKALTKRIQERSTGACVFVCGECIQIVPIPRRHPGLRQTSHAYGSLLYYKCTRCHDRAIGGARELTAREWRLLEFKDECRACNMIFDIRQITIPRFCGPCSHGIILNVLADLLVVSSSIAMIGLAAWETNQREGSSGSHWVLVTASIQICFEVALQLQRLFFVSPRYSIYKAEELVGIALFVMWLVCISKVGSIASLWTPGNLVVLEVLAIFGNFASLVFRAVYTVTQ